MPSHDKCVKKSDAGHTSCQIRKSSAKIIFTSIQNRTKLVSEKVKIPEIDGSWTIEAVAADGYTFSSNYPPPLVKVIIEIGDQFLIDSKLLSVTIDMNEVGEHSKSNNMFFANFKQDLHRSRVEIDTTSNAYQTSQSRQQWQNVYYQHELRQRSFRYSNTTSIQWHSMELYIFDCSITFNSSGVFDDDFSRSIRKLQSSQRVLSLSTFESIFEEAKFSDFTFIVRGKLFKVHKCLLSAASSVFETMFTSGSYASYCAMVDYEPEVFRHFLKFIYTNSIPLHEMPSICMDLYKLAHRYGIDNLMKICRAYVMKMKIHSINALDLYEFVITYEIGELLESTWKVIKVEMLGISDPCKPKSLAKINTLLEKKRKYEQERMLFIAGHEIYNSRDIPSDLKQSKK